MSSKAVFKLSNQARLQFFLPLSSFSALITPKQTLQLTMFMPMVLILIVRTISLLISFSHNQTHLKGRLFLEIENQPGLVNWSRWRELETMALHFWTRGLFQRTSVFFVRPWSKQFYLFCNPLLLFRRVLFLLGSDNGCLSLLLLAPCSGCTHDWPFISC